MKLVTKLTLTFALVTCVVLAANGGLRVRRELGRFHDDLVLDHQRLAHVVARGASAARRNGGMEAARAFIREVDPHDDAVSIRSVCETERAAAGRARPRDVCAEIAALEVGGELSRITRDRAGDGRRFMWVRMEDGAGAVEVSEPISAERRFLNQVLVDTTVAAVTMGIAFALTAFAVGTILVGRPTTRLMEVARRIGQGDFGGPIAVRSSDELGALAVEMQATATKLRDATKRASDEAEARIAMLEQLRHADRLLTVGRLASGIAHEMGTPLNAIEVRASMIANGELMGDAVKQSASAVVESCERMTRTIGQLLAFARTGTLERQELDVGRIARQTLALVSPLAAKAGITLTLDAPAEVLANVDELQIQQALTNIVINAIQALPSGGNIRVGVDRPDARPDGVLPAGSVVRIWIEDDGPGIAAEHLPRIFEPFFTTKEVGRGTGLGLSIADNIVREHSGRIAVRSVPTGGTAFDVFLPAKGEAGAASG